MPVDVIYVDESFTHQRVIYSALSVPCEHHAHVSDLVAAWRADLDLRYEIAVSVELHASPLLGGRGSLGGAFLTKYQRSRVFYEGISLLASWSAASIYVTNVCLENQWGDKRTKQYALDRLLNRIDRTLQCDKRTGVLIFDEGDDRQTQRLLAELRLRNPVPSKYGGWPEGDRREKPLLRLLGEPAFVDSRQSYLVQLVDFAAYALLKREEPPTRHVVRYRLHQAFDVLQPVLNLRASVSDPLGIVRSNTRPPITGGLRSKNMDRIEPGCSS